MFRFSVFIRCPYTRVNFSEIYELFVGSNETVRYIRLHTVVPRAGCHCIFVQQFAMLGFISFGLQCVFVKFSSEYWRIFADVIVYIFLL